MAAATASTPDPAKDKTTAEEGSGDAPSGNTLNNNVALVSGAITAGVEAVRQSAAWQTATTEEGRASIAEAAASNLRAAQDLVSTTVNSDNANKTFNSLKEMLSQAQTIGQDGQKRFQEALHSRIQDEFGEEIWNMLEAIQEVMDHFHQELKIAKARYGNMSLAMALPLVHMEHDRRTAPTTSGELRDLALMDEACHWVKFATAAYGLYTTDVAQGDDRAKVLRALENTAEVVTANLNPKGVQSPGYFVAIDRKMKALVLGIRGTSNIADAITDAVGQAVPVTEGSKTIAHKAMLASARSTLEKAEEHLAQAASSCQGYRLVLTGHSLGAGTAIICTELLRSKKIPGLLPGAKLQCFAYAPPPVLGPKDVAAMPGVEVYSFVNRFDLVPRASMSNGFHLGREAMAVDGLELSIIDRINLIARALNAQTDHREQVIKAVEAERSKCAQEEHPKFQKLFVPGSVFWIEWPAFVPGNVPEGDAPPTTVAPPVTASPEQTGSVKGIAPAAGGAIVQAAQAKKAIKDLKDDTPPPQYLPQKVYKVDTAEFQRLLIPATADALFDHLVANYATGLQIWRNTLEREVEEEKKKRQDAEKTAQGDAGSKKCCTVQ
mmetsp:Transcript_65298/g.156074  ORF Transcript_65298/g.156074 Transcript_65298/m.156074 type:complete len:607 (-) Transcript_65298:42-1862(-)